MPTRLNYGEGSTGGEAIDTRTRSIRRCSGHGTLEGDAGNRGRPVPGEGSGLNAVPGAAVRMSHDV